MKNLLLVSSVVFGLSLGAGCALDPTYTHCAGNDDCELAEECFLFTTTVTDGRFCSEECTSDSQCERNLGFSGACMGVAGVTGLCFQECDFTSDCFSSSECVDFTDTNGVTNAVCVPTRL